MDLTRDAMLVSLRINNWSGRRYDREASNDVALRNDADPSAGRYNKRPPAQGGLRRHDQDHEQGPGPALREYPPPGTTPDRASSPRPTTTTTLRPSTNSPSSWSPSATRSSTITNTNIDQARIGLGGLFRTEDYPAKSSLRHRFAIQYRIVPVPNPEHFLADLAAGDADRVKRDIEALVQERLQGRHHGPLQAPRRGRRPRRQAPRRRCRGQAARFQEQPHRQYPRPGRHRAPAEHLRRRAAGPALPAGEGPHRQRRSRRTPSFRLLQSCNARARQARRRGPRRQVRRLLRPARRRPQGSRLMTSRAINDAGTRLSRCVTAPSPGPALLRQPDPCACRCGRTPPGRRSPATATTSASRRHG